MTSLPGMEPNIAGYYYQYANELGFKSFPLELVELNDCLYRNLYRHDYLVVMDIDEMIVPNKLQNWLELLQEIEVNTLGFFGN